MGKRIVINVDGPGASSAPRAQVPAGKRRRWSRVLTIATALVLLILVVAVAGGFVWWRHYQSTPVYTLTLMIDAAQRDDVAEFQKRVDGEAIAQNMVTSVSQKAAARYGLTLNSSIQDRINTLIPSLVPRLKESINAEITKEIKAFAAESEPRPFVFLIVAVPSLITVTTEGETAKATAAFSGRMIELSMRRDADRWKVTEYKDEVVVQRIVDSVMTELPAIGSIDSSSPLLKKPARRKRRR